MSDVFSEVDEQVRSDRLRTLASKGWPIALAAALLALLAFGAVWGWRAWQDGRSQRASDTYAQGLDALSKGDGRTADARFADVVKSGPAAYQTLALMQQSGIRLSDHKDDEAVALLERAGKAARSPILGDAASLKAAMILMDRRPLAEIETRLAPLTASGRPYRWAAIEARGLARLQGGQTKAAHADFAVISLAQDVSDASRARARAAMALIDDGSAAAIPGLVKAALAAPPALSLPLPPAGPAASPETPSATAPQAANSPVPAGAAR